MSTLYLHIGMTKTGSTSIEVTLHESRAALLAHGIDYLDLGQNHSKLMQVAARQTAKGLKGDILAILGLEKDARDYDPKLVLDAMVKRFRARRAPITVMSGQGGVSLSADEVRVLRDFVTPHFDEVRVIVYVRDPTTWASSRAQENMKRGHTLDELVGLLRNRPNKCPIVPGFRKRLEPWLDVFGRDKVDIRLFDPKVFPKGDLIADFMAALGKDPAIAETLPRSYSNRGASAEALLLIQAHYDLVESRMRKAKAEAPTTEVRAQDEDDEDDDPGQFRHPSFNFPFREAVREIHGTKFALPKSVLDEVWALSMDDVVWLRDVTGRPDLFAAGYPPPETPPPAWSNRTLQDLAEVIERGIGDRMAVDKRRTRVPKPVRLAQRLWYQVRSRIAG